VGLIVTTHKGATASQDAPKRHAKGAARVEARDASQATGTRADEGRQHPGTAESFGRDLRAVVPSLRTTQHRTPTGDRVRCYEGIALGVDWHRLEQDGTGGGTGATVAEPVAIQGDIELAQADTGDSHTLCKNRDKGEMEREEKSRGNNGVLPVPSCATRAADGMEDGDALDLLDTVERGATL
jgi:hypothetical protein